MVRLIALIIGYLFGLFQTSYFLGKEKGFDIRKTGSGNAGTTNALRTMGLKAGALVMIGDIVKSIIAIAVVRLLLGSRHPEISSLLAVYAGLGAILGHNFPFYLGFRGGKGVACTAGLIISLTPWMIIPGIILFFGTVTLTHYVSLASLLLGAAFFAAVVVGGQMGVFHMGAPHLMEMYILIAIVIGMMYWQHRGNIKRLLSGTERKTYIFKKKG